MEDVPLTTEGWLEPAWGRTLNLEVSEAGEGTIGHLPATVVEVRLSPSAQNDELDNDSVRRTPASTSWGPTNGKTWARWGIAGNQVQRLYLADATYGGEHHVFVVALAPNTSSRPDPFIAATD